MTSSSSERIRTRAQRVAQRVDYKGLSQKFCNVFIDHEGWQRLLMLTALGLVISLMSGSWNQPLQYRLNSRPDRDVVCNTRFSEIDLTQTSNARETARKNTLHYYAHDPAKLDAYKKKLRMEMQTLMNAPQLSASSDAKKLIVKYLPPKSLSAERENAFNKFQQYFDEDVELVDYKTRLDAVFQIYESRGVLKALHSIYEGSQEFVKVYDAQNADAQPEPEEGETRAPEMTIEQIDAQLKAERVRARDVIFGNGSAVKTKLNEAFGHDTELVELLLQRIRTEPPETLAEDVQHTLLAQRQAVREVSEVWQEFHVGEPIIRANEKIGVNEYRWLKAERLSYLKKNRRTLDRFSRWFGMFFMTTMWLWCAYLFVDLRSTDNLRIRERPLKSMGLYIVLFALFFLIGRVLQIVVPNQGSMVEIIPVLIFAEISTFALSWSVAIPTGVIMSFALTVSGGGGFEAFLILSGSCSFVAAMSRHVRTRLHLVWLAIGTGACVFLISAASGLLSNNAMRPTSVDGTRALFLDDVRNILRVSTYRAMWGALAGVLTTCILPLVELWLHVVTPMLLLEYANPSHPLMLELNQRAPATYSHSIQTATLAEAAAEAIGARAYLAKVGAYFHDVGKMLKPEYFTENQNGVNIHDTIEPGLSALVIIAHVKDGVNLGKRYKLPQQIIDLIEQHHGTMLVSFFYAKALKKLQEEDPNARLDEAPFRYPGPVPQTKEAAILMLADAAESASRSITEWTPRRVETLVRKITEARIEDGQFRDADLTLREIQKIQQSLVTTLLASHHSRVKYPDMKDKPDARDESRTIRPDASGFYRTSDSSKIVSKDSSEIRRAES